VIGFVYLTPLERTDPYLVAFHQGLAEAGYIEGNNVAIEYRWAQGENDRLPGLIAELVRRQVSVIVALASTNAALAAKAATQTIPVVFSQGADPVRIGLVDSLNRPGGNLTGINTFLEEVAGKRLQLLLEAVPSRKSIGYLYNPTNPIFAESEMRAVQAAADAMGVQLLPARGGQLSEIESAFAYFARERIDALYVSSDGFLFMNSDYIVPLAQRHAIPAIYGARKAVPLGGLMSYGTHIADIWRLAGIYTGKILKGEKPTDLPVQQPTKFELVINLRTAKSLGLTIPPMLLARADEVIE
jgi:putative ABC transport system substrate-binding protein